MSALMAHTGALALLREHFDLLEIKLHDGECDDRADRRFEPAFLPIELRISAGGEHWTGLLADVSENGARIIADRAPEPDRQVTLAVGVRGGTFILRGRVAHASTTGDVGFFGVAFTAAPVVLGNPNGRALERLSA